jgi:hypothetical protein
LKALVDNRFFITFDALWGRSLLRPALLLRTVSSPNVQGIGLEH